MIIPLSCGPRDVKQDVAAIARAHLFTIPLLDRLTWAEHEAIHSRSSMVHMHAINRFTAWFTGFSGLRNRFPGAGLLLMCMIRCRALRPTRHCTNLGGRRRVPTKRVLDILGSETGFPVLASCKMCTKNDSKHIAAVFQTIAQTLVRHRNSACSDSIFLQT